MHGLHVAYEQSQIMFKAASYESYRVEGQRRVSRYTFMCTSMAPYYYYLAATSPFGQEYLSLKTN